MNIFLIVSLLLGGFMCSFFDNGLRTPKMARLLMGIGGLIWFMSMISLFFFFSWYISTLLILLSFIVGKISRDFNLASLMRDRSGKTRD